MSYGMNNATGTGFNTGTGQAKYSAGGKSPKGFNQYQNFTPEQMQLFQSLFEHLEPGSYLSRLAGGDQELFKEIEEPALRQFTGIQGNIASKYSGAGMGGRHSSGFQNEMSAAGQDFSSQLQSQRQSMQQQAIKDLMGMSSGLLSQEPYSLNEKPKKSNFWEQIFGNAAGGAGQAGMLALFKALGLF
jgi:hypothetical protein